MKDSTIVLFNLKTNLSEPSITFETNWYILSIAILLILIITIWKFWKFKKNNNVNLDFETKEITIGLKDSKVVYNIVRNFENIEIAHKIYIELVTRKAAIKIDKEKDVIKEVYDSWNILFKTTRDETKKIPGKLLSNNSAKELIKMSSEIINEGLRPHLTEYQAKFRKWYELELTKEENNPKTPQEIQKDYPEFESLVNSMLDVNNILIDYAKQLEKFIYN